MLEQLDLDGRSSWKAKQCTSLADTLDTELGVVDLPRSRDIGAKQTCNEELGDGVNKTCRR